MFKNGENKPPRWIAGILLRLSRHEDRFSLMDDLEIEYGDLAAERERLFASVWYVLHVLRALPELLYILFSWRLMMLKNYVKTAFRNIKRHKGYTFINVAGLALGIVCALVIFLIIRFELSFDTYHPDTDRIYRVVSTYNEFGEIQYRPGVPHLLPQALRNDFPEIERVTIVDNNFTPSVFAVTRDDGSIARFKEDWGVAFVDPAYIKIFRYQWIQGDQERALMEPHSLVLSKSLADKFFGDENPLGKRLTYANRHEVQVTGVVADAPANTDLPFNLLIAYNFEERGNDNWGSVSSATQCYLKLSAYLDPRELETRFDSFLTKYQEKEEADNITLNLQPLRQLHFDTRFNVFTGRTIARESLVALGLIGLLLIITAGINFVNLNTSLAVKRSREVGVRKSLGGTKAQLTLHFLAETALIVVFAVIVSLTLAELALAKLQSFLGYRLGLNLFGEAAVPVFLFALFVLVTIGAGSYPALHLSRFKASEALRNKFTSRCGEGLKLRKGLVFFQFAISQALIICTIVINSQMAYFRKADMGFNKQAVVEVELPTNELAKLERLRNRLLQHSAIKRVSFSNTGTASSSRWSGNYTMKDSEEIKEGQAQLKFIDERFIDTYELRLLAGEGIAATDTLKRFIVNHTFAREVGYGEHVPTLLGKFVKIWGREAPISGVVKDFNTSSLHDKVEPIIMMMQNRYWNAGIKIDLHDMKSALAAIEQAWTAVYPDYVFDYAFLDDTISEFYEEEQKTAQLTNLFTIIAIIIGCMGLFGLISYMTAQRTKEIGIRKVLGARSVNILSMFLKEFVVLTLLAFVLAAPVAHYFMQSWLANFAYRIELGIGIFLLSLLAVFVIVLLTVSFRAIKAATANPVDSLRYE